MAKQYFSVIWVYNTVARAVSLAVTCCSYCFVCFFVWDFFNGKKWVSLHKGDMKRHMQLKEKANAKWQAEGHIQPMEK